MRLSTWPACVLQEALRLQPGAVAEACLLAQLYMLAGLPEDALESARALRHNAPADADSHALFILMKEAEGLSADSVPELAQAYVDMLQCDPASQYAVQGMDVCKRHPSLQGMMRCVDFKVLLSGRGIHCTLIMFRARHASEKCLHTPHLGQQVLSDT